MRIPHKIKPNKSVQTPTSMLFVDVEATLKPLDEVHTKHVLRLGWACYWRRRGKGRRDTEIWQRFTTRGEFWDIVIKHTDSVRPLYLIAHNVNYDFGVLHIFSELATRGYELTSIYLSGMTALATFMHDKRKIIMLDNMNYFHSSLAVLGASIGLEKLDTDPLTASDEELDPYCKRDVEIPLNTWKEYLTFIEVHDLGCWGKTLPSQAFRAYRHRFMPYDIYVHNNKRVLKLERAAYHGGRTSVFYQGELTDGPYYKLDVNSMYPYVMVEHPYPVRLKNEYSFMQVEELERQIREYDAIAQVGIETDEPVFPVLQEGHLIHPVGQFETVLNTPEIAYALEHAHILSVKHTALYHRAPIFRDYVEYFYKLKQKYSETGQTAYRTMAKLYLNSLYGKFGQKAQKWEICDDYNLLLYGASYYLDKVTGQRYTLYPFDDRAWIVRDDGESYNSFPAIAAHVTAYARLYLWELIMQAGRENVYYCDTDSLIVNQPGLDRLRDTLDDSRLGALKIEETEDKVTIKAPKVYAMGEAWKRKGISSKAEYLGHDSWRMTLFPSFRTQSRWPKDTPFHTVETTRRLSYHLYDGKADADGWVRPLKAESLTPEKPLPLDIQMEVAQLQAQIEALKEAQPLDHQTVFQFWDYRKNKPKQVRNRQGNLVSWEYALLDEMATEQGFPDGETFVEALEESVRIEREIAELNREIEEIKETSDTPPSKEPIPF